MKYYGYDSNGVEIDESTVDELYRIAENEILPEEDIYILCDTNCSIDEDSFEYFATGTAFGSMLSFKLYADFEFSDDSTIYDYINAEVAFIPYASAEIQTTIIVENNEIKDIQIDDILVFKDGMYSYGDSTEFEKVFDKESFKEAVRKITEPTVYKMATVLSNI
jgi:protein associated with RNAse G/E